jgi:hypothetical protein
MNDANAEVLLADYANGITMCGYVNLTTTAFYETFWAFRGSATEYMTMKAYVTGAPLSSYTEVRPANGDTVWNTQQPNFFTYTKFIHVCQRYDTDYRYTLWKNGTVIANVTQANWDSKFEFGTPPGWKPGICAEEASGSPDNPMSDGQIAFLGIWNRSLSTAEIETLYNNNVPLEWADLDEEPVVGNKSVSFLNATWNMTSDGGDLGWTYNPRIRANTTDGTPTMTFSTNESANCSLKDTLDVYDAGYICGTTGGTDHICTLSSDFKLDFGSDNLFVACKTFQSGFEANSSALPINMTAGGGGSGLVDCISAIGSGCGISIEDNCAAVSQ